MGYFFASSVVGDTLFPISSGYTGTGKRDGQFQLHLTNKDGRVNLSRTAGYDTFPWVFEGATISSAGLSVVFYRMNMRDVYNFTLVVASADASVSGIERSGLASYGIASYGNAFKIIVTNKKMQTMDPPSQIQNVTYYFSWWSTVKSLSSCLIPRAPVNPISPTERPGVFSCNSSAPCTDRQGITMACGSTETIVFEVGLPRNGNWHFAFRTMASSSALRTQTDVVKLFVNNEKKRRKKNHVLCTRMHVT